MKKLCFFLVLSGTVFAAEAELSLCGTEELLPIGFTDGELLRLHEIGTYQDATVPPPAGVRNPGEFEPATGVMVRWPLGVPYEFLVDVSNNSELRVIVSSSQQGSAQSALASAGVNMANTDFIIAPTNSVWVRDYGPWFIVLSDGSQGIFDYSYNRPRPDDDVIPQVIGSQWGIPVYISDLIHTGGNYMSGGLGESMSTNLVYDEDPHPGSWVDQQMEDYLGVTDYTTYEDPQASYIDHIDCWAKILSPDRIMVLQVPPYHGDYAALETIADFIDTSPCPYGYDWDVYRVFSGGTEGYVNGLLHNDTYYLPVWNTGNDAAAAASFSEALPGYTITPVYYFDFANTDALHCRTRNVMDRYMLEVIHTPVDADQTALPVSVSAFIRPNPANTLTYAFLCYRVNSGSFVQMGMTAAAGNTYTADIPGLSNGDFVDYYIKAGDSSGRVSAHPQFAPETWFNSYTVTSTGISANTSGRASIPRMLSANPFSSSMVFTGEPDTEFTVYDSAGRTVHRGSSNTEGLIQWNPQAETPDGVYFIRFGSGYHGTARAVFIR